MAGQKWKKEQLDYLLANYADKSSASIAEHLGVSLHRVYNAAHARGLKKSEAFKQSAQSGRLSKLTNSGKAYRYPKGHIPQNKGKRMDGELYSKVQPTFFPKGHLPHNTKEDGAISKRYDKTGKPYLFIRVSLGKWVPLQKVNWEKVNGELAKGLCLWCLDGNTLNCDAANWEAITRAQNMQRNTYHNYPKEIANTVQLRGALNRQINKRIKLLQNEK